MPHAISSASPGLQALILCGPGSSFPTFTSNPDENPKALLPIANRPMVWYPLDFCYRTGITNITLICPPSAEAAITAALNINPYLTALPVPSPTVLAPKELDLNAGTAEILGLPEVRELVTSDFMVLPCDLVCELAGEKLLQAWMIRSASLSDLFSDKRSPEKLRSGGLGVWYETRSETPIKGQETDFIATATLPNPPGLPAKGPLLDLSRLVYSIPTDSLKDLTEEKKGYHIRYALLRKHSNIRMLATHRDAHIYIFPHWIMDFVQENERLESIGEDIVGWWAKASWQEGLAEKLGMKKILEGGEKHKETKSPKDNGSSPAESVHEETGSRPSSKTEDAEARETADHVKKRDAAHSVQYQEIVPPILAYIHSSKPTEPLIRRVDTSQLLLATSLQLAKLPSVEEAGASAASPFAHARKVAYPEGVKPRTTITKPDSLVGENVTVAEKTSIKESVVGANCQIHEGAKLSQCLLMDGVVVGKGCKLTKCILGKRSQIGEGSILTECEVQENLLVEPKTDEKGTKLMSSEGLEATEEEMQEALQSVDEDGINLVEDAIVG